MKSEQHYSLRNVMFIIIFASFLLLSACGGGGGGISLEINPITPPVTPPPPTPPVTPPAITMTVTLPGNPSPTLTTGLRFTISAPNAYEDSNYTRDSEYTLHYGLEAMNAEEAYKRGYFGQGVTIAIADSGVAIDHPDFDGRIVGGYNAASMQISPIYDADSHGTFVALFAAGGIGNSGNITTTLFGGREIETSYFHGVAPSASIMPLQLGDENGVLVGDSADAFRFAVSNNVQIVNNSYGFENPTYWKYRGRGDMIYRVGLPIFNVILQSDNEGARRFQDVYKTYNELTGVSDIVYIWASGNDGWHYDASGGTPDEERFTLCGYASLDEAESTGKCDRTTAIEASQQDLFDNLLGDFPSDEAPSVMFTTALSVILTNEQDRNDPGGYSLAPFYEEGLLNNWLVVGSVDEREIISGFSNGCGVTKFWCLVAPGDNLVYGIIPNGDGSGGDLTLSESGTSFSAPHVSGALAVLKSRLPGMPMEVARAILLTTAKDLGETGVDDLYGWGLVNLSAAINFQGTVAIVQPPPPPPPPPGIVIDAPNAYEDSNYTRDFEYTLHYGLEALNAEEAYKRGYFGQGVTIGIADSGVATTHPDFAGRIVGGYNAVSMQTSPIYDALGHGTFVALFAAGGIGNSVNITTTLFGGSEVIETSYFHGVAPSASIMPLQLGDETGLLTGSESDAFRFAASNNVQIVNNSYGLPTPSYWKYKGQGDTIYRIHLPFFNVYARRVGVYEDLFQDKYTAINQATGDSDIAYVWAAGNNGWHYDASGNTADETRFSLCGYPNFEDAVTASMNTCPEGTIRANQQELIDNILGTDELDQPLNVLLTTIQDLNDPGGYALAPIYHRGLLNNWLVVGSVGEGETISGFSNGCGIAKFWCLVAPGERLIHGIIPNGNGPGIDRQLSIDGTSFSAPHVSGALAVLKSRLPGMPMEVVRAILLTTAKDLGATGVDDLYGWGLVNLSSAINFQGTLSLITAPFSVTESPGFEILSVSAGVGNALGDIKLLGTRIQLPADFSHVQNQLREVEIAVGGVGDAYYNTKLSDLVNADVAAPQPLGDAAADMLSPQNIERFTAGVLFAATDTKSGQFQYVGADINSDALGDWRFQHNFCDNCEHSVWRQWGALDGADDAADDTFTAPFFAADKSTFVLRMQGEGLRPFAAFSGDVHGDTQTPYQQIGFRWKQKHERFGYLAEVSQIDEQDSFWGANFGALGHAKARTRQGRFAISGTIFDKWRGHASYERAFGDVRVNDGGILSGVSKLRAEGWALGMEGRDIFLGGDHLRIAARRNAGISGGSAILRYVRAEGDFTCAFYKGAVSAEEYAKLCDGANAQQTSIQQSTIDLAGDASTTFALGYAMRVSDNTRWAVGAEYETERDIAAFSAQMRIVF